jgi:hypothetical protein
MRNESNEHAITAESGESVIPNTCETTTESALLKKTRAEARASGEKRYFNGKACPQGHITYRFVSSGSCCQCVEERRDRLSDASPSTLVRELKKRFTYNRCDGTFRFRRGHRRGMVAGSDQGGYVSLDVNGRRLMAHIAVWLMEHGEFPQGQIDHIDRNRSNNCRTNLREVSQKENVWNSSVSKNNKLGVKGVTEKGGKFRATIFLNGRQTHLGLFDTIEEAKDAYECAAVRARGEFHCP